MKALAIIALFIGVCQGLNNSLGRTPQMGFNSWNYYYCSVTGDRMSEAIDQIVSYGLKDLGYEYVVVDDCWAANDRDKDGNLVPDPKSFPNGIKPLADKAHQVGLKFGIYSSAGFTTCAGRPASLGRERQDANTFASWGVDYLKYDNCASDGSPAKKRYGAMRDALLATGRPIFYSICSWGTEGVAEWGKDYGNSWRTTDDVSNGLDSIVYNVVANDVDWASAGAGGWNDPDMLRIGNGSPIGTDRINFAVWAVVKAPIIISCDLTKLTTEQLSIIKNKEVIGLNQDPLGIQGRLIYNAPFDYQIWTVPQSNGTWGVVIVNLKKTARAITLNLDRLGFVPNTKVAVRDLWRGVDMGMYTDQVTVKIAGEDCQTIRLTPQFDFGGKIYRMVPKGLPGEMRPFKSGDEINGTVCTALWNNDDSAKWKVINAGDGWVYLQEQRKNLYLDLHDGNTAAGTMASVSEKPNSDTAKWRFVLAPAANNYRIENKAAKGKFLDSLQCKTRGENPSGFGGGTVGISEGNFDECQYWSLVEMQLGEGK